LEVTAQLLSFEPGLYSVQLAATETATVSPGFKLPCVCLYPIPSAVNSARAFVATLCDNELIQPGDEAAYLRVRGGTAPVLLTIYKLAGGMAAPELRIKMVHPHLGAGAPPALPSEPLQLIAHVERTGDVSAEGGSWAGQPGGGALEGFSIALSPPFRPDDIEYQAVLGRDWTTPWVPGNGFCGSRGLSLPLLGVRVRLSPAAGRTHSIRYYGCFARAGESTEVADGDICAGNGAVLEALRVCIVAKIQGTAATTAKTNNRSPRLAAEPPKPPIKPRSKTGRR
jgi:hypothetical protein